MRTKRDVLQSGLFAVLCALAVFMLVAGSSSYAFAVDANVAQTLMVADASANNDVADAEVPEEEASSEASSQEQGEAAPAGAEVDGGQTDAQQAADPSTPQNNDAQAQTENTGAQVEQGQQSAEASKATNTSSNSSQTTVAPVPKITATVVFVGPEGEWGRVSDLAVGAKANGWDATLEALKQSGMPYKVDSTSGAGVITSLAKSDGSDPCELDVSTGSAWHLYINGEKYEDAAATYTVKQGDELEWHFDVGTIVVSVSVVGPGGTGTDYWISPTEVEIAATGSAWDASLIVFEQNGYIDGRLLSYTVADDGSVQLESLASLGENGLTGERWQVFVNGVLPEENIALLPLHAGDSICWYYAGNGEASLPSFAEKTGAASQNPAANFWIEGVVTQAWSRNVNAKAQPANRLSLVSDVFVLGGKGSWSLTASPSTLSDSLTLMNRASLTANTGSTRWQGSLARLMDGKVLHGDGGQATLSADGSLYYLDTSGSVVKLELE